MKGLARKIVWWPNLDKDIEYLIRNCSSCNLHRDNPKMEVHYWEEAKNVFDRVHIDFAGPFLNRMFFVLVDAHSKYPIVKIMKNITAESTSAVCREIFSEYGFPKSIVSDNGRTFVSSEFKNYLKEINCVAKLTAPYQPATNGQAENMVNREKRIRKIAL